MRKIIKRLKKPAIVLAKALIGYVILVAVDLTVAYIRFRFGF